MKLIDADNIEKELRYTELSKEKITWLDAYKHFKKMINNAPTAYDIDKVVEQLENLRTPPDNVIYPFIWEQAVEEAIEIVEAGGVDEQSITNII